MNGRNSSGKLNFELDSHDWPNREASLFLEVSGVTWHVQVLGHGPTVLCVHGLGAASHSFGDVAKRLSSAFTVVVPDLPGHGFTGTTKQMSLHGVAADLGATLEALAVKPQIVVGHASGAAVLAQMCLDGCIRPEMLIALNGAFLSGQYAKRRIGKFAKSLCVNPVAAAVVAWIGRTGGMAKGLIVLSGSKIPQRQIAIYERLIRNRSHVAAAMSLMADWKLDALEKRLKDLHVPVTLAVATRDRAIFPTDAERLRGLLPNAQSATLQGLGHFAHEEAPRLVANMISGHALGAI